MRNDYLMPAIVAVVLALIFPVYWFLEIFNTSSSTWDLYQSKVTSLDLADLVFVIIGIMSIFVFYSLKKALNDRTNFKNIDALIWVLIAISIIFHVGTTIFGVFLGIEKAAIWEPVNGEDLALAAIGAVSFIIFGVLDILIGLILIRHHKKLPAILLVLAVVSIIQGIFEISLVQGALVVITYPIYLIILAVYFLKEPETIEVV